MYGWQARIGVIVPAVNTVLESECYRLAPEGVSIHSTRMPLEAGWIDELAEMAETVERDAELLASADVDVIAYGCTTGSLLAGPGYDEQLEERISTATEIPAVATASSIKHAFDALDIEAVSITTPYYDELNDRERDFLEQSGYDVVDIQGLDVQGTDIGAISPEMVYREAGAVDDPAADGIFISCTDYRTIDVIDAIERNLGKPVVTSNQATFWDALRTAGVTPPADGPGMLFEKS